LTAVRIQRGQYILTSLEEGVLELVLSWRNQPAIREASQSDHLIQLDEHRAWYRRHSESSQARLLVFESSGIPSGCVNFTDIKNGTTRWGFYLDPAQIQKGLGVKMGLMALDLAFSTLGVQEIHAEVLSSNQRGLRYHVRLGFREVSLERHAIRRGGSLIDLHRMILSSEVWSKARRDLEVGDE